MSTVRWLTVLFAAAAAGAAQKTAPATVEVSTAATARVVVADLPGAVLGVAAAGDGRLAVLAATAAEAPRKLWLLDPRGEAELTAAALELPSATRDIARLPSATVVVGEPGKIFSPGPGAAGPAELLLESPHLDLSFLERQGFLLEAAIWQPLVGRLLVFRPDDDGRWAVADQIALPLEVRRERRGLRLQSPPVTVLERAGSAPLVLAGPVARAGTRLLTTWIDADTRACGDPDCEQRRQRWCRLPGAEVVTESFYLDVDGRATLVVATAAADKLGVFERKRLRVFPLWSDRTRAGAAATLAAATTSRRWQQVEVEVVDLDGDDRDDLAVLQRHGLGGKKVVIEVYKGTGNGGFFRTPRQSEITAPDAFWRYGPDVDGDRRPDLVLLTEGRLLVFAGVEHGRRVVDKRPRWSFEPPVAAAGRVFVLVDEDAAAGLGGSQLVGGLELIDLDDDGRHLIVLWSSTGGRTRLRVVELG